MRRREFVGMAAVAAAWPAVSHAQQNKMPVIGFLDPVGRPGSIAPPPLFIAALRNVGLQEGQNLTILHRSAQGRNEKLPGLAAELVGLKPDLIVAWTTPA